MLAVFWPNCRKNKLVQQLAGVGRLRNMDLMDLRKKQPILDKAAYSARVKSVMRSRRAQTVAKKLCGKVSQGMSASG